MTEGIAAMLVWEDNSFNIGKHKFQTIVELSDLFKLKNEDGYVIGKTRSYIDKYYEHLGNTTFSNVFELGIFRGGSTVFLSEMLKPQKLVAIDFEKKPVEALDCYIRDNQLEDRVKPFYGVDQSDIATLSRIYNESFGSAPLDLVVDDASHYLDETRKSFNFLFPKLRAGGIYIIEDWAWANFDLDIDKISKAYQGKRPLSNLTFEIVLASATAPQLFHEVCITSDYVLIKKGHGSIDGPFNISDYSFHRGQRLSQKDYFA
ncbi:class I SAM-dependent methyltransferase [Pseudomonas sp. BLCC-B13]|uniref:class I SAM-dependent methyltransferase n=1 Tax=Pseudomonas sp. BLCC-B13 TaxID=3025314 RepID=UPI00234EE185|nr:class I SAM-dependent methyltransferase [Pseudomonas sp. BLCC-B13]MDC7826144.1 class I SAM-dependent methyltransferase [Pseudomonas sp. BLCC-B13]